MASHNGQCLVQYFTVLVYIYIQDQSDILLLLVECDESIVAVLSKVCSRGDRLDGEKSTDAEHKKVKGSHLPHSKTTS